MSTFRGFAHSQSICYRCFGSRQLRSFSQSSTLPTIQSPPPPPSSGAARLTTRRLISLQGIDAPKFLQGIISNSLKPDTTATTGFFAAFLSAQGKVLNDAFVYPTSRSDFHNQLFADDEPGFLVEVDAEDIDNVFKHIKRHKLRAKFKLRLLDVGEVDAWSVWKEDERWTPHTKANIYSQLLMLSDCRAPGMGRRILVPASTPLSDVPELEQAEEAPLSAYTIRRYIRGVPEGQKELPREECLPMNANLDIMGGIDFKKGCYIGQELTIRTHHTGVVRRRVLPVSFYNIDDEPPSQLGYDVSACADEVEEGSDINRRRQKKRPTGRIIASTGNIGLAMCRLEQMSDLTVSSEAPSFRPDDKFTAHGSAGTDIGVRAFVPDWIRGRIREPKVQKRIE